MTPKPAKWCGPLSTTVVGGLALLLLLGALAITAPSDCAVDPACALKSQALPAAPDDQTPPGTAPAPVDWRQQPIIPRLAKDTAGRLRRTLRRGLTLGLRANVFAKAGDSITVDYGFLQGLGCSRAHLAGHPRLRPTAAFFARQTFELSLDSSDCGAANSFSRHSAAARPGEPSMWALGGEPPSPDCLAGEAPLPCEYRLVRPAFALIMFGTMDAHWLVDEQRYADQMAAIVRFSRSQGVSPILFSVPPKPDFDQNAAVEDYNRVLYQLAGELHVPVINLWRALERPDCTHAFVSDGVHLCSAPLTGPGEKCEPLGCGRRATRQHGAALRSLITLETLHRIEARVIVPVTTN